MVGWLELRLVAFQWPVSVAAQLSRRVGVGLQARRCLLVVGMGSGWSARCDGLRGHWAGCIRSPTPDRSLPGTQTAAAPDLRRSRAAGPQRPAACGCAWPHADLDHPNRRAIIRLYVLAPADARIRLI